MMKELGKRCRSGLSRLIGGKNRTPVRYENELTLHLSKDELFDRRVLLPHAELNEAVYQAVDRFVKRYSGREMTLTIYCGPPRITTTNTGSCAASSTVATSAWRCC